MAAIEIEPDGTRLTPVELRRRAMSFAYHAQIGMRLGTPGSEELGRRALTYMVDAFLHDRRGHQDLFAQAHRLGAVLSATFGCPMTYVEEEAAYDRPCPVLRLHATVGLSVAFHFAVKCSICGGEEFECDHISGEQYEGEMCSHRGAFVGLDHVALTPNPDFNHTWVVNTRHSAAEFVDAGLIAEPGEGVSCTHCRGCYGIAGPGIDDLDRWRLGRRA